MITVRLLSTHLEEYKLITDEAKRNHLTKWSDINYKDMESTKASKIQGTFWLIALTTIVLARVFLLDIMIALK